MIVILNKRNLNYKVNPLSNFSVRHMYPKFTYVSNFYVRIIYLYLNAKTG